MKFAVGQPVTRVEDTRLITGQGKFTDDQKLPEYGSRCFYEITLCSCKNCFN